MIRSGFEKDDLSLLGFGTMRLPLAGESTDQIDEEKVQQMVDYAIEHGINYFDTAYMYHKGRSETVIGRALKKHPRESFRLATKYPGHMLKAPYDPAAVFEEQLQKCGVDYFDYYLLHCVTEKSMSVYTDPQWGIIDYFEEQKRLGRIRHFGFSCHAEAAGLEEFLNGWGEHFEFCQIQLNYLDWTLQNAKRKCELLKQHGIPVWVMEPVRGGKLAKLPEGPTRTLRALRPEASTPEWAFRFLQGLPEVQMILSGMSDLEQMTENIATFAERRPLTDAETSALLGVAELLKNTVPCTGCRYCTDGCPASLEIPKLLALYNELVTSSPAAVRMAVEELPEDQRPGACLGCGACAAACPQKIDVPAALAAFDEKLR